MDVFCHNGAALWSSRVTASEQREFTSWILSAGFSTLLRVRCVQSCPLGFLKNAPVIIYNIKVAALKWLKIHNQD